MRRRIMRSQKHRDWKWCSMMFVQTYPNSKRFSNDNLRLYTHLPRELSRKHVDICFCNETKITIRIISEKQNRRALLFYDRVFYSRSPFTGISFYVENSWNNFLFVSEKRTVLPYYTLGMKLLKRDYIL